MTILVVGLSVFVLVTSLAGVYLASRSPSVPPARRPGVFLAVGGTLVAWFALVFALGLGGAFRITTAEEFRPTLLLAVLLSTAAAFVLPLWLAPFRLVLNALPQHWLIVVHAFRAWVSGSVFLVQSSHRACYQRVRAVRRRRRRGRRGRRATGSLPGP